MSRRQIGSTLILAAGVVFAGRAVAGSVTGVVKYAGTAAPAKKVEKTKDAEVCGKASHTMEDLIVGAGGALKNAVVTVNVAGAKPMTVPTTPAAIAQKGCWFNPHIQIVAAGQDVNITNDDGILHNIHTTSKANPAFNKAQPKFMKVMKHKWEKAEIVKLACDVHNWMTGWVVVAGHPYTALTGADGSFKIDGVPAGTHDVKYWHEKLGEQTGKVTVAASGDGKADLSFPAK
jgi:plastocyanin